MPTKFDREFIYGKGVGRAGAHVNGGRWNVVFMLYLYNVNALKKAVVDFAQLISKGGESNSEW